MELVEGETVSFSPMEGHCLDAALRRALLFLPQSHAMFSWLDYLEGVSRGKGIRIAGIPEDERAFLEGMVASECAYLTELAEAGAKWRKLFKDETCAHAGLLPCGHDPAEHLNALREWFEREVLSKKRFSETRRLVGMASPAVLKQLLERGKPVLATSDAEQRIREELLRWRELRNLADEEAIRHFDDHRKEMTAQAAKSGLSFEEARERFLASLQRARETAEEEYRKRLSELLRKHYTLVEAVVSIVSSPSSP